MTPDYASMSPAELDAEIARLQAARDVLRDQAKAATLASDAALAAEKVAALSDAERAALRAALG